MVRERFVEAQYSDFRMLITSRQTFVFKLKEKKRIGFFYDQTSSVAFSFGSLNDLIIIPWYLVG